MVLVRFIADKFKRHMTFWQVYCGWNWRQGLFGEILSTVRDVSHDEAPDHV